jgi:hypothetical protein
MSMHAARVPVVGLTLLLGVMGCGAGDEGAAADAAGDETSTFDASDATRDAAVDTTLDTATTDSTGDTRTGDGAAETDGDAGPPAATFPRLGGMLIGNPKNYDEPAYQKQIARLDVVVLGMYVGWARGGKTPATVVKEIKALNPKIRLANYTVMTEASRTATSATEYKVTKLGAEKGPGGVGDWWARDNTGAHVDWSGGAYNAWDTNLTLLTTPDSSGDHYPEWLAGADYERLLKGTGLDVWYCDNNFWRPRTDADWNRDGTNDDRNDVKVRNWYRDGQRAYYDRAKKLAPSMLLMGNTDNDLSGDVHPLGADKFTQFSGVLNAAFIEHVIGKSWSVETYRGFKPVLDWYREVKTNLLDPRIVVIDAFLESKTDYQTLRYALSLALLDDGYFSASTDYNEIVWYDEFDLAGKATTGWLGAAVDPPPAAPYEKGVWRRRFANGMALVNPKGNGAQTVTIGAGYRKILGTQAPTINDGSKVTTVTLADRDGILLVTE